MKPAARSDGSILNLGLRFLGGRDKERQPGASRQSVKIRCQYNQDGNDADQKIVEIFFKKINEYQKIDHHKSHIKRVAHIKRALVKSRFGYKPLTAVRALLVHFIEIFQIIGAFGNKKITYAAPWAFIE
jgi:hypothetical protein